VISILFPKSFNPAISHTTLHLENPGKHLNPGGQNVGYFTPLTACAVNSVKGWARSGQRGCQKFGLCRRSESTTEGRRLLSPSIVETGYCTQGESPCEGPFEWNTFHGLEIPRTQTSIWERSRIPLEGASWRLRSRIRVQSVWLNPMKFRPREDVGHPLPEN